MPTFTTKVTNTHKHTVWKPQQQQKAIHSVTTKTTGDRIMTQDKAKSYTEWVPDIQETMSN